MSDSPGRNIRLGTMVLAGIALLITTLYIIGKNEDMFGSHFSLRARFRNINGLMIGNNIRFAGIQAGTVRQIRVLNDTTIEVELLLDTKLQPYIHKNALAAVGTEGLIGNKIVNIIPMPERSPVVDAGDLLAAQRAVNTDDMLLTLDRTNRNIAEITDGLKLTVSRINSSSALWDLLNDKRISADVRRSLANLRSATEQAQNMTADLHNITRDIRNGKGSVGRLLVDTAFAGQLDSAVARIRHAGEQLGAASQKAGDLASSARSLVQDTALQSRLYASMENIRKGTAAFSEDMEALKHNFLLRGYFRRQEKAAKKQQKKATAKTIGQ